MGLGIKKQKTVSTLYPPNLRRQVPRSWGVHGSQESNTVINLPVPYLIPLEGFSTVTKTIPRNQYCGTFTVGKGAVFPCLATVLIANA
jgi:hypothetical protein